jgi:hypothetical protein
MQLAEGVTVLSGLLTNVVERSGLAIDSASDIVRLRSEMPADTHQYTAALTDGMLDATTRQSGVVFDLQNQASELDAVLSGPCDQEGPVVCPKQRAISTIFDEMLTTLQQK